VKKLVLLVVPLLVILMLAPLLIALLVAGIIAPAVVSTIDCRQHAPVAAGRDWRPPFQQRYTRTSPFGRRYHPISGSGGCTPAKTWSPSPPLVRLSPPHPAP